MKIIMNIYTLKCVYFVYGGNTQMDNSQKKIIKYTVILAAAILLLNITGSHFFSAKSKDNTRSVVTVEAGSLNEKIPAVARNFEKKLEYGRGNEMLKHYEIKGKGENDNLYGYVQIWETNDSLEHYLNLSKEYMSMNAYGFSETDVNIDGVKWRKWEYIINGISAAQAFCKIDDKIYMCSLFVSYQERTYAFDKIFTELMKSTTE